MEDLLSGGVDGLVSLPTDGVDKLSIDEDLVGEVDLSVVGMKDCLCVCVCVCKKVGKTVCQVAYEECALEIPNNCTP